MWKFFLYTIQGVSGNIKECIEYQVHVCVLIKETKLNEMLNSFSEAETKKKSGEYTERNE